MISKPSFDLSITGDVLLSDQLLKNATILVKDGKTSGIAIDAKDYPAKKQIYAKDKLILPGVIDAHVHACASKIEGFEKTSKSAGSGGVTTIVDMASDPPSGISTPETLKAKIKRANGESYIDVALLCLLKNDNLHHINELLELGACGFFCSLTNTDDNRCPRILDANLLAACEKVAKTGLSLSVHCENDEIVCYLTNQCKDKAVNTPGRHCETRPELSETVMALKALEFAKQKNVRLHLCQISSPKTIDLALRYKNEGAKITSETCPQYLLFNEKDMEKLGALIRINPPVRSEKDVESMWSRIKSGQIDCIASDHCPWPLEMKSKQDIFENLCGIPGVATLLPLIYSEGVLEGKIDIFELRKLLIEKPAKIYGLYPRKGSFQIGSDADIVIFDPQKKWSLNSVNTYTSVGWIPYDNMPITGKVITTIVRGKTIFDDDQIVAKRGHGKFIRPVS